MFWVVAIATATGVVLGLWLRVPAVIAVSMAIVFACSVLARVVDMSLLATAAYALCSLTALQIGYLAALAAVEVRARRDRERGS